MQGRCSNGFKVSQEKSVAVLDPHSGAPDASIDPLVGAKPSLQSPQHLLKKLTLDLRT